MTRKRRRAADTARKAEAEAACLMTTLSHAADRGAADAAAREGTRERERETRAQHSMSSPTDDACEHRQPKGIARVRRGEGDGRSNNYGTAEQSSAHTPGRNSLCRQPPCHVPTEESHARERALQTDFPRNQQSYRVLRGTRVKYESRVRVDSCSSVTWPMLLVPSPMLPVFPYSELCVCAYVSGVAFTNSRKSFSSS